MIEVRTLARRERLPVGLAVVAVHLLFAYLLIRGIGFDIVRATDEALKVFDVRETIPPPRPQPQPKQPPVPVRGTPAPPALRSPQRAPTPIVPIPIAPSASGIGVADRPGIGTGAGGEGAGSGGGGVGSGSGAGGPATHARLIRREFHRSDYPREARAVGAEGIVRMRIEVAPNGRVSACSVTTSSGNAALDATTCRLAQKRFRYEPARDAKGRPVPDVVLDGQRWWIDPR